MHVPNSTKHNTLCFASRLGVASTKITSNPHVTISATWPGSVVSRTSISFENLANIRPVGVVSKNCNGACNEPINSERCNAIAANRQPIRGASWKKKFAIPEMTRNKMVQCKLACRKFVRNSLWIVSMQYDAHVSV